MSGQDVKEASGSSLRCSKRMHLSGLNADQCSLKDLQDRFGSFGLSVSEVHNWPPLLNAVEQPTDWCFLTLTGEENKIRRAVDLLHGTLGKGKKLRISKAKERAWQATGDDDVNKDKEKKQKKKRVKGVVGMESETLHTPITAKDVEKGEWGWKKTPAGHLVRPMHMRPDHPLPKPTIIKADEETKDPKKTRRKQNTVPKPLTRAKRITIDPSRYGAIHLSKMMLEDPTIEEVPGQSWSYEEEESEGTANWTLRDEKGDVIRSEQVTIRQPNANTYNPSNSEYSASSSQSEEEEDDGGIFDEIDAAIDQASDISDSEEDNDINEKDDVGDAQEENILAKADGEEKMQITYPHYDPDEEDAFSDGYQEMTTEKISDFKVDHGMERQKQLDLLKRMFGDNALRADRPERASILLDDDDDESIEDAATKEEVIPNQEVDDEVDLKIESSQLAQKDAVQGPSDTDSDSSDSTIEKLQPADIEMQDDQEPDEDQTTREEDRVEISTLTDMFRPKEDKGGFSIMANLDLELDDEFNFEPDIDDGEAEAVQDTNWRAQDFTPSYTTLPQATKKQVAVFPSLDTNGFIRANGSDFISSLARQLRQKDPSITAFFEFDDPETISQKWEERKSTLTQVYKRRHREALKKKKRKFTGSRAAGTALPGRRVM
jgi:hypothetical protein